MTLYDFQGCAWDCGVVIGWCYPQDRQSKLLWSQGCRSTDIVRGPIVVDRVVRGEIGLVVLHSVLRCGV